jgi:hypothetical protein
VFPLYLNETRRSLVAEASVAVVWADAARTDAAREGVWAQRGVAFVIQSQSLML